MDKNNSKNFMHKIHSLVSTQNDEIYTFGNNMYCKLGVGNLNKYFTIGVKPVENEPILVKIYHTHNIFHVQILIVYLF